MLLNVSKKVLNTKNAKMDMESLTRLCRDLNIDEAETSFNYLEFMKSKNEVHIQNLRKIINIIPVSNTECERDFSQMNLVQTKQRASLSVRNLGSLLYIAINGPPEGQLNA